MRNTESAIPKYAVGIVPSTEGLKTFLENELRNISAVLDAISEGQFELITVAPIKPREGMVRLADAGVLGATKDLYVYIGGAWKKAT